MSAINNLRMNVDELWRLRQEDKNEDHPPPPASSPVPSASTGLTYESGEPQPLKSNLVSAATLLQGTYPIIPAQTLPDDILAKIKVDDYVDFKSIIYHKTNRTYAMLIPEGSSEEPKVFYAEKNRGTLSKEQWNSAWDKYSDAFAAVFPESAPDLRRYGAFIRELMTHQSAMWVQYDESFRQARKIHKLPYCVYDQGLFTKAQWSKALPPQSPPREGHNARSKQGRSSSNNDYICFAYNSFRGCSRSSCAFRHICRGCKGLHSKLDCEAKPDAKSSRKKPQDSRAGTVSGSIANCLD